LILDEKAQPDPYIRHRIIRRTFDFRENLKIFSRLLVRKIRYQSVNCGKVC